MDTGREIKQQPNDILEPAQQIKVPHDKVNEYLQQGYRVVLRLKDESIVFKEAVTVGETKQDEAPRESQADRRYILLISQNIELFHDQNKTEFAKIPLQTKKTNDTNDINAISTITTPLSNPQKTEGEGETAPQGYKNTVNIVNTVSAYETVRLKDEKFKTYLAKLLYDAEGKVANKEAISQVILLLKYDASHGKCYNLYNRVAPDPSGDGSIWLDMVDAENRAYHITKDGWFLESNVPILFRRYEHQRPLAEAAKDGDATALLEYVNIGASKTSELTKHRRLLLLVQTASYLIPDIAHPVNAMFGCPGSFKSSAQRFIREVLDPSAAPLLRLPRDENAALQVLDHHYIPIFDNLDFLPRWFSDMLCGAVTGAGQESRALYTDDDSFIRSFRRCVMLNGLNLPATKGDLLNRTIMHPTEPNVERRTEDELNKKFKIDLPKILGGFLDLAFKALKIKETMKATKLFRLADFSEWGVALANALGETDKDFNDAMEENLKSQNTADIENNLVADAFLAFVTETLEVAGAEENNPKKYTPNELFTLVAYKAIEKGVNTKNTKRWPSAANGFTRRLNESKSALLAYGWNYEISHTGTSREIAIWYKAKEPKEEKHICFVECERYDKKDFCKRYGNLNQYSERPSKCDEFTPKVFSDQKCSIYCGNFSKCPYDADADKKRPIQCDKWTEKGAS